MAKLSEVDVHKTLKSKRKSVCVKYKDILHSRVLVISPGICYIFFFDSIKIHTYLSY